MQNSGERYHKAHLLIGLMLRKFGGAGLLVAAGRVAFLVFVIVLSRAAGSERFGLFIVALMISQIAAIACSLGTSPYSQIAVSNAVARNRADIAAEYVRFSFLITLTVSSILSVAIAICSVSLRSRTLVDADSDVLLPLAMLLIPMSISSLREFVARAYGLNHLAFAPRDIYWTGLLGILIICYNGTADYITIIAPFLLLCIELIAWMCLWRKKVRHGGNYGRRRRAVYFHWARRSILMMANFIVGFSFERVDTFAVSLFTSLSTAGVYAAASRVAPVVSLCQRFIVPIILPNIAAAFAQRDFRRIRLEVKHGLLMSFAVSGPVFIFIEFFADEIMSLFGGDFSSHGGLLRILCAAQLLIAMNGPLNAALMGGAPPSVYARLGSISLMLTTVALVAMTTRYGAVGAAVAVTAGIALLVGLVCREVFRRFFLSSGEVQRR